MNWTSELIDLFRNDESSIRDHKLATLLGEEKTFPEKYPFFNGDKFLRNSEVVIEFSNGEKKELIELKQIPNKFFKYTKMEPYLFQSQLFDNLFKERFVLIRKGRQLGISKIIFNYSLYKLLMCKSSILVISNKPSESLNMLIQTLRKIPIIYQVGIKKITKSKIEWENGSLIKFISYNNLIIGRNYDVTLLLDSSFCSNLSMILNSIVPSISARVNEQIIIEGNILNSPCFFNELCAGNKFPFKEYIINSLNVPNRDQKWEDDQIFCLGGVEEYLTEFMCLIPGTKEWNREINLRKLLTK